MARMLVFGLCFLLASAIAFPESDDVDTDIEEEVKVATDSPAGTPHVNVTWYCPEGWAPFPSEADLSCLLFGNGSFTFANALKRCTDMGGTLVSLQNAEKEAFVKNLVAKKGGEYWIGLSKDRGYDNFFNWHTLNGKLLAIGVTLPQSIRDYQSYKGQCVHMSSFTEDWELSDCTDEYNYICQANAACTKGMFGSHCQRQCHCAGESCLSMATSEDSSITCKWGCERNWMGPACDKNKKDPDVKYFCIDTPDERYVHIRINVHGVDYKAVYGLTERREKGNWCNGTRSEMYKDDQGNDYIAIKIPINNQTLEQINRGDCVGQKVDEETFSWDLVVKENAGILMDHDLQVHIACNFSVAEKLQRADNYVIAGKPSHVRHQLLNPESISEDVQLEVVSAYSGEAITEAAIGSTVILQMTYGLLKGSMLQGIFPYNCTAYSSIGKNKKQLLDRNGCSIKDSPLQPFAAFENHTIQTPWFNLFAFEDAQSVIFQCSFELCFDTNCKVGCGRPEVMRLKRDAENTETHQHMTTRTIRVLPSISPQKISGEPKPKTTGDRYKVEMPRQPEMMSGEYQWGHLLYMNPVTLALFLFLLLIFLCMYISFLRIMRKSLSDIRKEMESKRSRDKFLNCGCPQKDRDYISL